jgi:hypothetical protein
MKKILIAILFGMLSFPSLSFAQSGCQCGCAVTGVCICKNCDLAKLKPGETPKTHCICGCVKTGKCVCKDCNHPKLISDSLTYAQGCALAVQTQKPLVTFVGTMSARSPLYLVVTCFAWGLEGYPQDCIVISIPNGSGATDWNGLNWVATLPSNATNEQIMSFLQPQKTMAQPLASPFGVVDGKFSTPPGQGGCANGQCGVPQRSFIFRRR